MKVFGWLGDQGACAWYRLILPLGALRQSRNDFEARWGNDITKMDEDTQVVIAQRPCLKGPSMILRKMAASADRPKIVVEWDDDLMSIDEHNRKETIEFYGRPEIRANLIANLRLADLVTVSTEPLAEVVRQFNQNVLVLPNCVPGDLLTWQSGYHTDRFTVGWQGSATHDGDWQVAAKPIQRWFEQARQAGIPVEFHTFGTIPRTFPELFPHRHTDALDIDRFYRALDWHVAVAPLAKSRFNRSKSNLRVLEAAALGMPVVASDVHAYSDFVVPGETGFLAKRPKDWGEYLGLLAADHDLRYEMSDKARTRAMDFTVEGNCERWLSAYQSLGVQ